MKRRKRAHFAVSALFSALLLTTPGKLFRVRQVIFRMNIFVKNFQKRVFRKFSQERIFRKEFFGSFLRKEFSGKSFSEVFSGKNFQERVFRKEFSGKFFQERVFRKFSQERIFRKEFSGKFFQNTDVPGKDTPFLRKTVITDKSVSPAFGRDFDVSPVSSKT